MPPRMIVCTGSSPTRRTASSAASITSGWREITSYMFRYCSSSTTSTDARGSRSVDLRGEPPQQRDVLGQLRRVVVADDQLDRGLLGRRH